MKSDIARLDPIIFSGKYIFLKCDKEPSPDTLFAKLIKLVYDEY